LLYQLSYGIIFLISKILISNFRTQDPPDKIGMLYQLSYGIIFLISKILISNFRTQDPPDKIGMLYQLSYGIIPVFGSAKIRILQFDPNFKCHFIDLVSTSVYNLWQTGLLYAFAGTVI
jgi:hypothetical protein